MPPVIAAVHSDREFESFYRLAEPIEQTGRRLPVRDLFLEIIELRIERFIAVRGSVAQRLRQLNLLARPIEEAPNLFLLFLLLYEIVGFRQHCFGSKTWQRDHPGLYHDGAQRRV